MPDSPGESQKRHRSKFRPHSLVRNLLLNCGQRDVNFADDATRLELHSRRARELFRETFFDKKHPEASARRLSNERPSFFAPFEMKCTVTLIDLCRNIHAAVGGCQRPVFARIRTQFIDRHNEGKRCSGIDSVSAWVGFGIARDPVFQKVPPPFSTIQAASRPPSSSAEAGHGPDLMPPAEPRSPRQRAANQRPCEHFGWLSTARSPGCFSLCDAILPV